MSNYAASALVNVALSLMTLSLECRPSPADRRHEA